MDKKDILRLAKDPRYISGIYNYCDRWCERCPFTSRCLNYAVEKEDFGEMVSRDLNNKAFWDKLQLIFQQTKEMITELAMERGINLNSLDMEFTSTEISLQMDELKNHELSKEARHYSEMVDMWFESEHSLFEQREDELNTMVKLGIGDDKPYTEADEITDAVEVIRWYQHQIYVKLLRALTQDKSVDTQKEDNSLQNDSNGSALVALIAIDRSIGAWGRLQKYFPEKTDNILSILLHLDRALRRIEQEFPDARKFPRPGFDDMN